MRDNEEGEEVRRCALPLAREQLAAQGRPERATTAASTRPRARSRLSVCLDLPERSSSRVLLEPREPQGRSRKRASEPRRQEESRALELALFSKRIRHRKLAQDICTASTAVYRVALDLLGALNSLALGLASLEDLDGAHGVLSTAAAASSHMSEHSVCEGTRLGPRGRGRRTRGWRRRARSGERAREACTWRRTAR